jgi:hypothetical protein
MAILAECDICGAQHRVKDALGGGSIRCKECGVQIEVLKESVITSQAFIEENGRLRRREPEREVGLWSWMIAVIVSGFVVLALVVVVWGFSILVRFR